MVSTLAKHLIGSEIVKIGNAVNEQKAAGANIANLTIGDLDSHLYLIPTILKNNIQEAYEQGHTNYPPANGILSLRESVKKDIASRYQLDYSVDDILITAGSRPIIYALFLALIDQGDKVIIPVPSWNNNHYAYMTSAEKILISTTAENNFLPTASQIKEHIKGATLLTLCSPQNPTGTMFSKEQLLDICELVVAENKTRKAGEKPLYVMYDQVYALLTYESVHYNPVSLCPEMRDYCIFVDGISKSFAATGVRVGWVYGPKLIVTKMKEINSHIGAWAPKPEQVAVANYIQNESDVQDYLEVYKNKLQNSLQFLYNSIQNLKQKGFRVDCIQPMGALYLSIQLDYLGKKGNGKTLSNGMEFNQYLIEEAGMAMVPFSVFGNTDQTPWFRASIGACSIQDLEEMMPRLEKALKKLE